MAPYLIEFFVNSNSNWGKLQTINVDMIDMYFLHLISDLSSKHDSNPKNKSPFKTVAQWFFIYT
jgi:hypothetical protein